MGYDVLCRRGFSREAVLCIEEFAAKAPPTSTHKPTDTIASSLLRGSAASKTRRPPYCKT
ncbi:hypothetical protein D3C84_981510 [compost metagenome]